CLRAPVPALEGALHLHEGHRSRPGRPYVTMREAAAEIAEVAVRMDDAGPDALEPTVRAIAGARRVMLFGCGREGLMMQALAMRLHHLGLEVCMQGDMTAFPIGAGDLFLCAAGPGALATATALCAVA